MPEPRVFCKLLSPGGERTPFGVGAMTSVSRKPRVVQDSGSDRKRALAFSATSVFLPFSRAPASGASGGGGGGSHWAPLQSQVPRARELWGAGEGAFLLIAVVNASLGLGRPPAAGWCHCIWHPVAVV